MKVATLVAPDGTHTTVTADGKPLGSGDIDRRVLHILPKLFVPSGVQSRLKPLEVLLEVETTLDIPMLGIDDIRVRQPYPNTRYYVGGSQTSRNGWVVNLPDGVDEFDIKFKWEFFNAYKFSRWDELHVEHLIHVKLLPGDNRTYTMDSSCWPRGGIGDDPKDLPFKGTAISLIGLDGDEDPRLSTNRDIIRISELVFKNGEGEPDDYAGQIIEENLTIPPVAYEKVWSLRAFEEEQLHEVEQVSSFQSYRDEHKANAAHEMPASLLLSAIHSAREIPFGKDSAYLGKGFAACEGHPALVMLNEWWEAHRTDDKTMRAGHAMPWVRVKDDDEYWCGYGEVPNTKIGDMAYCKDASARVGDSILLVYCAAAEHFTYPDPRGVQTYLADGKEFNDIGVGKDELDSGEYDEAWYALEALARFPSNFSAAYTALAYAATLEKAAVTGVPDGGTEQ
ncbi:hypothetical protein [Pseudomonas amygdali]|uniref:hypothetical protein n=1 Tax=Pseudomonas amygdali TaxID=47877 RepID=UPI0006E53BFD|nr:hypothetical protein [Pseudomonas amygdali]KPY55632.1 hypothetical protein ALO93_200178 [Pseudomonas amygdali pv. sesami]